MDLVREVLDKQIVDSEEKEMGRADGVILVLKENGRPRVESLELGFEVLAARLHPRLAEWVHRIRKRWSVRRSGRYHVQWSLVEDVTQHHIKVSLEAEKTPAFDWEMWLRKHVVEKIPGSEKSGEK